MSIPKKEKRKDTYRLNILEEWADGDTAWLEGFIELLLNEIPQKIEMVKNAYQQRNSKKLAYELHQLSSQLCLLNNEAVNKLLNKIEKRSVKEFPMHEVDLLIEKSYEMLSELESDLKNKI